MKLVTKASILTNALRNMTAVIERRNTIPVLGCVRIDGRTIAGTDLDMELSISVPASAAHGSICIDHRTLLALIRNIPGDDEVTIAGGKEGATVTFSLGQYDLPTLPVSDFPEMAVGEARAVPDFDPDQFRRALAFAAPFISTEKTRYYLNGVCLDGDVAVATDGHRLGCCPSGGEFQDRPIIPRKAVRILTSLPAVKKVELSTKPYASFTFDGASLVTKLIDGTFPDWRRVVPTNTGESSRLTIERARLISAVKRAVAVAGSSSMPCGTLAWANGRLALAVKRPDSGSAREYVHHASAEGEGQISFNLHYLTSLLSAFRGAEVEALVTDSGSPTIIRDPADTSAFTVIMPMRGAYEDFARGALAEWPAEPVRAAA